jgi:anti-sigma B factor antagonist
VRSDGIPVVSLSGELDITRSQALTQRLMGAADNRDIGLVVDLTEVTYIDSAAVNVLFEVAEALRQHQLAFAMVVPDGSLVDRVVTLVDLGSVARLHRSVEAAVADVRPR